MRCVEHSGLAVTSCSSSTGCAPRDWGALVAGSPPVWKRCRVFPLNRAVDGLIENGGFVTEWLTNGYMRGPSS
jgi:hypothetical protein